jgi:ABC-type dipeptide/oligopeptide/nickel transport system permease subunit
MLIYGARVSLAIGIITGLLICAIGCLFGVLSGYLGGAVDMLIMRVVDVMLVIPTLPITIVLTNLFGTSYIMIVFIFTVFGWTGLARIIRSQVLVLKSANYVKVAEIMGASKWWIMFRHIIPGCTHLLIMSTALTCAGIMVAEAGLSFLGLGDPAAISWGKMLADAQGGGALLFGHWWWILTPGIGIFLSVYSFMRVGLALEEIFNPAMKKSTGLYKLFKHMNNAYLDKVFAEMDGEGRKVKMIDA